jgi:O-antigen ligase
LPGLPSSVQRKKDEASLTLTTIVFAVLAILILRWPYLGIVIILSSLSLVDILPSIPETSSVVILFGGVTLVGFFIASLIKKEQQDSQMQIPSALIPGLLFLLWILTNISAAITPAPDGRFWIFTYIQLWILAWLASLLLKTPRQVHVLMWGFFLAGLVSALYASSEGVIGLTVKTSVRTAGLAAGINGAARYFLIALMFGYFLLTQQKKKLVKFFLIVGMVVLLYGVFVTVSRTGLLLLVAGLGLLLIQNLGTKNKIYLFILAFCALVLVWVQADNIVAIFQSISGSILAGTDTVGIRYGLWQAGLRMWADNTITGVGIGQFSQRLPFYGRDLLRPRYLSLGPHNMYIAVLSETGLVGLIFFLAMFAASMRFLFQATHSLTPEVKELAQAWIIILALVLIAGITKQDQYDKLTWMAVGVSMAISRMNK